MIEMLGYGFMRHALAAGILAAIACGIIGAFVVTKKIVSASGGIAHASFGGIGIGYFFGIPPVFPALIFGVASGILIGFLGKKTRLREDTSIGIVWAAGMSIGIVFLGLSKGYATDLFSYLFGNILAVTGEDLAALAILDAGIIAVVSTFFKEFVAISFDEEFAEIRGLPAFPLYLLLLAGVALTVVILMKVVGIILVIAMLTIPAATAGKFASSMLKLIVAGTAIALFDILAGLMIACRFDLPAGATIVLAAIAVFCISRLLPSGRCKRKIKPGANPPS